MKKGYKGNAVIKIDVKEVSEKTIEEVMNEVSKIVKLHPTFRVEVRMQL